jgi:hypothetical protein
MAERAGTFSGLTARSITAVLSLTAYGISIYLYAALRHLLETGYGFYQVSRLLGAFIYFSVALAICSAIGVVSQRLNIWGGLLSVLSLVPMGIMNILLGIWLLRLESDLYGMKKAYAYLSIACGACYATLVLFPFGLLMDIAGGIIAAIIFFRESEKPAEALPPA